MSKGLEALENIMKIYGETNSLAGTYDSFLKIKKDLDRLEKLEKAIEKHLSKLEAFNSRVPQLKRNDICDCLEDLIDRLEEVLCNE